MSTNSSTSLTQDIVKGQIYKITCLENNKIYIGKTQSHTMNHGKYRPYGHQRRLVAHFSEADGNYVKQSTKLNNAIRKYGRDKFKSELICECDLNEVNDMEAKYIAEYNSIQNGYNIRSGGDGGISSEETKLQIAETLKKYYFEKKLKRFTNKSILSIKVNIINYSNYKIAAVYVITSEDKNKIKVQFGGVKCDIKDSVKTAIEYAKMISDNNKSIIDINDKLIQYLD